MTTQKRKAVALISGGLDSMLAAKLILDQGVHVEGLNFYTGFCHSGHTSAIRNDKKAKPKRNDALWTAEQLGIKLHIIDIVEEYQDIVINPEYGYGQHVNPCFDCKIFMVKKAREWMVENNFDFIITGEVIGQRPKSQLKRNMPDIAKESGAFDRLLRPLCAKGLPETYPELQGWVERKKLLDLSGRNRTPQIELAKSNGFDEYSQPAGGCCVLTDGNYATKLKDMWAFRGEKRYNLDDIILLKVGRHIRPNDKYKLIISREEGENNFLEGYRKQFIHFRTLSHEGPLSLLEGEASEDDLHFAARIIARFSQGRDADEVEVEITNQDKPSKVITVKPLHTDDIPKAWYI